MLFKNRYRIETARLPGRDYTRGSYLITICTKNRECHFGFIRHGIMCLSWIGSIVADEWQKTAVIRPNVRLDAWVVMPNHVHMIVGIRPTERVGVTRVVETPWHGVSTTAGTGWKSGCLGAIIGQFKIACTKRIRTHGNTSFAWQPRFHDRIIRHDADLPKIRAYIVRNPAMWERDRNNPISRLQSHQ